jgi:hypothetical protein
MAAKIAVKAGLSDMQQSLCQNKCRPQRAPTSHLRPILARYGLPQRKDEVVGFCQAVT